MRAIELEVIWFDHDMIELRVRAGNGLFSGSAETYVGYEDCASFAERIAGFPTSIEDEREVEFGSFDPEHASGGARFRFQCRDRWGHTEVEVRLRADTVHAEGPPDEATFTVPVEPAAIDEFIRDLRTLEVAVGATARLKQAP